MAINLKGVPRILGIGLIVAIAEPMITGLNIIPGLWTIPIINVTIGKIAIIAATIALGQFLADKVGLK